TVPASINGEITTAGPRTPKRGAWMARDVSERCSASPSRQHFLNHFRRSKAGPRTSNQYSYDEVGGRKNRDGPAALAESTSSGYTGPEQRRRPRTAMCSHYQQLFDAPEGTAVTQIVRVISCLRSPPGLARTKLSRRSARGAWGKCTALAIRGST